MARTGHLGIFPACGLLALGLAREAINPALPPDREFTPPRGLTTESPQGSSSVGAIAVLWMEPGAEPIYARAAREAGLA